MRQTWRDVVFLHWETDPALARRLLPAGTRLDLEQAGGRTFVGLVGLRLEVAVGGVLPMPHLGSFGEVNVRLYSVDQVGRRGVVFCSLDAGRLLPVLGARAGYRLPYAWSDVAVTRRGPGISYAVRRRWPGTGHPASAFAVEIGDRLKDPVELDLFLTARWTLHWRWFGQTMRCAVAHPPWDLYSARLKRVDDELISAAGLPPPTGRPVSVRWSPGVSALIGAPMPVGRPPPPDAGR